MPVVGLSIQHLRELIGTDMPNSDIIRNCQELGCDVEGLALYERIKCGQCGNIIELSNAAMIPKSCDNCSHAFESEKKDFLRIEASEVLRLDLLANRPDNFDAGGLARSIRGYLGIQTGLAPYTVEKSDYTVHLDPCMQRKDSFRPHITCAVLSGIAFTDETLKNIMKLQENLHWALGRDRKYASIGVYDLTGIAKTLHYTSVDPDSFKFVPLGAPSLEDVHSQTPNEILKTHPKGVGYAHLLKDFKRYPILRDENGMVLSMPPIINSENTKVTINSHELFIDVTGLDPYIINRALNIMITSIKEMIPGAHIKSVTVHYPDKTFITPDCSATSKNLSFDTCRHIVGVDLSDEEIIECLKRMRFDAFKKSGFCEVSVPCYRSDVKHEFDLIEDVAIAYGYKSIQARGFTSYSIGKVLPREAHKERMRTILTGLGFFEILTIMLTSEDRAYRALGLPVPADAALIDNPISVDQTLVRTHLASGLLETIAHNASQELPHRIFEVGEVIKVNPAMHDGTEEFVHLGVALADSKVGFADIKAVLCAVMRELKADFTIQPEANPLYLEGRSAIVSRKGTAIGHLGEVHPRVLESSNIDNPVVLLEIDITSLA